MLKIHFHHVTKFKLITHTQSYRLAVKNLFFPNYETIYKWGLRLVKFIELIEVSPITQNIKVDGRR